VILIRKTYDGQKRALGLVVKSATLNSTVIFEGGFFFRYLYVSVRFYVSVSALMSCVIDLLTLCLCQHCQHM
jgi:hypothetical protein